MELPVQPAALLVRAAPIAHGYGQFPRSLGIDRRVVGLNRSVITVNEPDRNND